jgi:hypothetical protein
MKKIAGLYMVCLVVVCAIGITACASSGGAGGNSTGGRKISGRVPEFVRNAVKNVPEDALVGIGTAKMRTISDSRNVATTRARVEISRQLAILVRNMVRDYSASSEIDPDAALSFYENFTLALSQSKFTGSSVVDEDMDEDGNYWCVVMLSKTEAAREISPAEAQAKLRVPAAASFNAEARANEAFDQLWNEAEVQVVDQGGE